jgi:hypothetical protein
MVIENNIELTLSEINNGAKGAIALALALQTGLLPSPAVAFYHGLMIYL